MMRFCVLLILYIKTTCHMTPGFHWWSYNRGTSVYTVVPLLKDTLAKENLSNKDRIIWQQVLWVPLILPLTKGHLSNEDRRTEFFAEGVFLLEGDYCIHNLAVVDCFTYWNILVNIYRTNGSIIMWIYGLWGWVLVIWITMHSVFCW